MQIEKRKVLVGVALVALGVVAVVATGALVKDNKSQSPNPPAAKSATARVEPVKPKVALSVTLVSPAQESWPRSLIANGNIVPWQEAVIGAELGGLRLTEVLVNVGDVVERGQLLARIDNDTVEAEVAQAKAAVDEAQAMNVEASSNAKRSRQLREQNFISDQQVTQTEAQEQAAAARLAAARARLKSSRLRLAQTRIEAPDAGVISGRHATVGSLTQPGQELFRLIRQNRLEWRAEVTAGEIARVRPGQNVTIVTAAGVEVKGTVRVAAPTVDAQTRNGLVYVDLPPASTALAGTFARGQFDLGQTQAMVLPQSAVLLREGFSYVYQLEGADRVMMTKVMVGRRVGDRIEILEGLKPDTRVVATGAGFLADGDSVRVVEASAPIKTSQ
jgi:HlyD family secretion protein